MAKHRLEKLLMAKLSTPLINGKEEVIATLISNIRRFSTHVPKPISTDQGVEPLPFTDIPGYKAYPLIGSIPTFLKKFDNKKMNVFWQDATRNFGPIVKFKLPFYPTFVALSDPDDIEKMYRVTAKNSIRPGNISLKKVRDNAVDNYFKKKGGLLVENNEEWWRVRSKVQTPMMKPKNVVKYLPMMDEVALQFMNRISTLQDLHGEMPANFIQEIYKWAFESVSLVALNKRLGCLDPNLKPDSPQMMMISHVNDLIQSLTDTEMNVPYWMIYPTKAFRKLQRSHDAFLKIADDVIQQTVKELKNKETEDLSLIEILLSTEGLTRQDVVTMILDMMFAGIDTTSQTLSFALYCLAKNKEAQKLLQEEVDSVLGSVEGPLTEDHLAKFSYMKMCVKESMRLFSTVAGTARFLEEDAVFSGYHVPKGVLLITQLFVTTMDEKNFPRAQEYLPERWSRERPYGPIHPYASLPFSHGQRMCIGRRIAEQEIYTFLARVVQRYEIDYKYADMSMITGITSSLSEPLRFEFNERRKQ